MRVNDDASASAPGSTGAISPGSGPAAGGPGDRLRAALRRRMTAEHLLAGLLGLLVLAVHDVGYLLAQPFWTDETWVAATTRFPLSQLPATTSSTPIGWSLLLRLVTIPAEQTGRLLPLAFAGAAAIVAYWFARGLGWGLRLTSVAAGLLAGLAMLLVPAMLRRDDLKQYTADACMAMVVLVLTSRLERDWSRRGLAGLSVAVWGGMLLSHTVAFIGAAALGAVCVVALAQRAWRRFAEAAVTAVVTAVGMLGVYEGFDARAVLPGLTFSPHFRHHYLPLSSGVHASFQFVIDHFTWMRGNFGLGPWWVAVPLFLAGLVTIFRLGRPATALALAVLWPEMIILSALHKYPFLDERTSTFLFAVTAVVAAIGVAGVCSLLRPWLKGTIAAGLAAVALAAFALQVKPYVHSHRIPVEDVRDQTRYVAAHAGPADVILVNLDSNWGFAYYWPAGQPARRADQSVIQEYEAYFPAQPRIVVAANRNSAGVSAAVSQAMAQQRRGTCARIWLVRTHVSADEQAAWQAALHHHGLAARTVGQHGLSVVPAAGSSCR